MDLRSYTKQELALLYFPDSDPDVARAHLMRWKGGALTKEDFNVAKYISGLKLRARATGELKTENLDTSIKLINLAAPATENPGNPDDTGKDNPSGGGSQTTGGGGSQTGGSGTTDSGSTDEGGGDNVNF